MSDENSYEQPRQAPAQGGEAANERQAPTQGTEGGPSREAPRQEDGMEMG